MYRCVDVRLTLHHISEQPGKVSDSTKELRLSRREEDETYGGDTSLHFPLIRATAAEMFAVIIKAYRM